MQLLLKEQEAPHTGPVVGSAPKATSPHRSHPPPPSSALSLQNIHLSDQHAGVTATSSGHKSPDPSTSAGRQSKWSPAKLLQTALSASTSTTTVVQSAWERMKMGMQPPTPLPPKPLHSFMTP